MWDFLFRALTHIPDYIGIVHSHELTLVEQKLEGNDVHSFIFSSAKPLTWKAGQHGIFTLPNQTISGKTWRAFSIASSPKEGHVMISTIVPETASDFKQKLVTLQPGDTITMRGPFGEFHTHNAPTQIVGIAGGIGITPLRAIAYEIANNFNQTNSLQLIYAGKNNYFTYLIDCEIFAQHPRINIVYVNTPDEVNTAIDSAVETHKQTALYYVSGSPGMIGAIRKRLQDAGIKQVINDPFKGY